jgi:hypothetical protein
MSDSPHGQKKLANQIFLLFLYKNIELTDRVVSFVSTLLIVALYKMPVLLETVFYISNSIPSLLIPVVLLPLVLLGCYFVVMSGQQFFNYDFLSNALLALAKRSGSDFLTQAALDPSSFISQTGSYSSVFASANTVTAEPYLEKIETKDIIYDTQICLKSDNNNQLVAGLVNTGNSCFLNSVLQVFYYCTIHN